MVKMSSELKKFYADKFLDLTNVGAGATLFGQLVSDKAFSWLVTGLGLTLLIVGYVVSYSLYPKGGEE